MTREEQIDNAASKITGNDVWWMAENKGSLINIVQEIFKMGAKWADENPSQSEHFAGVSKMIDWEQRRYEIAKEMLVIIQDKYEMFEDDKRRAAARMAIKYADALIEELNTKGRR